MKSLQFDVGAGLHKVEGVLVFCGKDMSLTIGGGDTPHVGAASVASPRESLKKDGRISATASVLCVMGHKDDMAARQAALRFASEFNCTVTVSVGLHIDNATEDDFIKIQGNFDSLLEKIASSLKESN
ncbi:MAG: hypothetical protein LBR98_08455 [Syntrophomonadaceae bacterium]|jgi:hypothetical protein|nr:hypothetical protein [Syntrophomonadaceae bacterium]